MTRRTAGYVAVTYFALYVVVLTYPGVLVFNRIRPLVLGLPFSFFWVSLWVTGAFLVLLFLELATRTQETSGETEPPEGV